MVRAKYDVIGINYSELRKPDPRIARSWAISNVEAGLQNLGRDLDTGEWERRYGELLALAEYDAGYRLVIAD